MNDVTSTGPERADLDMRDQDDSPQRFPLMRLMDAVENGLDHPVETWWISGVWGQELRRTAGRCASWGR